MKDAQGDEEETARRIQDLIWGGRVCKSKSMGLAAMRCDDENEYMCEKID
jgi:hypothetical protein